MSGFQAADAAGGFGRRPGAFCGGPRPGALCRAALAIGLLSAALLPGTAGAQCTVDPPGTDPATPGDIVTCATSGGPYAVDPGVADVTVNILNGVTIGGLTGSAITVNDDSNVTNHGTLLVSDFGDGVFGAIDAGNGVGPTDVAAITNASDGVIIVSGGDQHVGILTGKNTSARNEGSIDVTSNAGVGMWVGETPVFAGPMDTTQALNSGTITLTAVAARGIVSTQAATLINDASGVIVINPGSTDAIGMGMRTQGSSATNLGTITSTSEDSTAMNTIALTGVTMTNSGLLDMAAARSWGMYAAGEATLSNTATGVIDLGGDDSFGMQVGLEGVATNLGAINLDGLRSFGMEGAGGTGASARATLQNGSSAAVDAAITLNAADGVAISAGDFADVLNFGIIDLTATAPRSVGMAAGSEALIGQGVEAVLTVRGGDSKAITAGTNSRIINNGVIDFSSDGGTAVQAGANADITNNGVVEVRGPGAVGFSIGGHTSASPTASGYTLINQFTAATPTTAELPGLITSYDASAGPLVRFGTATSTENKLLNSVGASILANIDDGLTPGHGIAIQGGAGRDSIENHGLIVGKVLLGGGNDTYIQSTTGGLTVPSPGDLAGGAGIDTLRLREAAGSTYGQFDLGIVDSFEDLQVESGLWYLGDSPSGAMDIQVDKGATLSIVAPISVTGAYDHQGPLAMGETGATLQVFVNSETVTAPALHVTDTASFDDGTLDLKVGAGVSGDVTFTVALADGLITSEFDAITLDQAGIRFDAPAPYLNTNSLVITVHIPGYEGNQAAIAGYLTRVDALGPNPALQSVIDSVNGLALADYLAATAQLQPEAYDAQAATLLSLANRFNQILLERPRYCVAERDAHKVDPRTGLPCQPRKWEPWVSVYGQTGERTGDTGHTSWSDSGAGLVGGVDFRLRPDVMLGGSIGTAYDVLDVDDVGKGRLATVDLGLYGGWTRGPLRVEGLLSYGRGFHTTYRNITLVPGFGATAEGEFDSTRISTRAHAEYGFDLGRIELSPVASLDYTYLGQDALDETGATPVSLHLDTRADNVVTIRLGGDMELAYHKTDYWTDWFEFADGVWRPHLGLLWRQVVVGADRELTSYFIGTDPATAGTLSVEGDDASMGFELSAGLEFSPKVANRMTFGLRYDGFLWKDVQTHDLSAQVRFSF